MHLWYFADHTSSYGVNSGIERVTRCLAGALEKLAVEVRYLCWDGAAGDLAPLQDPARLEHLARWNGPAAKGWRAGAASTPLGEGWLLVPELVMLSGKTTLGRLAQQARARGMRVAAVFYDAIPMKLVEFYPSKYRRAFAQYMADLLECDRVAAISETSLGDLKTFLAANRGLGAASRARLLSLALPGELIGVPRVATPPPAAEGTALVLSVGTIELRKNHVRLLEAFLKVARNVARPVELAIVGGCHDRAYGEQFGRLIQGMKAVTWTQNCPDEQLQGLYRRCAFTVYPSVEEGFGLPVMESLWNGKPCICQHDGALGELAKGGGCVAVNVRSSDEIAVAMMRLLEDRALHERLAGEAMRRPIRTWQEYAQDILSAVAAS